jgi:Flp pilus assembly pilin Flp
MLRYYIKTTEFLKRLRADTDGVVSFEYVIVAACIIAAVAAAFGTGTGSGIGAALNTAIGDITTALAKAVTGA